MRLPVVVVSALALTGVATSEAVSDPVRATLSTSSTKPLADTPWRYTVVVKNLDGKPLAAKMRLQILLGPTVVGCWRRTAIVACSGASAGTWISFKGRRTGVIRWSARSAGVKRTFQAVIVAGTRSLRLRAPLTVRLP